MILLIPSARCEMTRTKEEILNVDDSLPIRTSMSLALGEMGYRVRTAEDGFAALREIKTRLRKCRHEADAAANCTCSLQLISPGKRTISCAQLWNKICSSGH